MQEFNSISQNRKNIFFIVLRQITSCIFVLENAAFGISETKIIAKRGA